MLDWFKDLFGRRTIKKLREQLKERDEEIWALQQRLKWRTNSYHELHVAHARAQTDLKRIKSKWNSMVDVINARGGQRFLDSGVLPEDANHHFTADDIKTLVRLCHPDKHAGSTAANNITRKLLALRDQRRKS